ncbi:hypothetical protein MMC12_005635 [Toensbergia leucococca]|nr:hypothetical protein [Toensbergia leucococca]
MGSLVSSSIISEVLDDFTPEVTISLSYNSSHEKVFLGNEIPVSAVASRPIIDFRPTNNVTYTLILTDPDAKSRYNPKWSEMCHWIISNITTNSFRTSDFTLTRTEVGASELIPYAPPAPPPKTGKHRYVFVLLSGETRNITAPGERQHWGYGKKRTGVQRWADEMGLKVVGANFFYAQNEKQ